MHFIPRNTWLLKTAFATPQWLRYILTILLWLTIFGFWYTFAYRSLFGLENGYKQNIITLIDKRNELQLQQKQLVTLEQSCVHKKKIVQDVYQQQESFERRIATLLHLLQEYNLSLHSYTPSNEIKKDWYITTPIFFKIQGNFKDLLVFLETLLKSSLTAHIKTIDIQRIQNELLQISLLLDIFTLNGVNSA